MNQKGFVKGRQGADNILDVNTLISQADYLNDEFMLVFLDTEKAFDSHPFQIGFSKVSIYHSILSTGSSPCTQKKN